MRKGMFSAATAALGLVACFAATASAGEFNFKDPKGVNSIYFLLDSELEPIMGIASGLSGTVSFDPAAPDKTTGKLTVPTQNLSVPNAQMQKYMLSEQWLDADQHPSIEFTFSKVKDVQKVRDNVWKLTAVGEFSCHGEKKQIEVPLTATYLKDQAGDRMRNASGDLLVLRADFSINRMDFKIKPDMTKRVVAEEIELRANVVGLQKAGDA